MFVVAQEDSRRRCVRHSESGERWSGASLSVRKRSQRETLIVATVWDRVRGKSKGRRRSINRCSSTKPHRHTRTEVGWAHLCVRVYAPVGSRAL